MSRKKSDRMCDIPHCTNKHRARGLCATHYRANVVATTTIKCQIDDCLKTEFCGGLCKMHFTRRQRHGDPSVNLLPRLTAEMFFERLLVQENGCWNWQGEPDGPGYGATTFNGERWRTHRLAYYLSRGKRPKRYVLHSCDNRLCCNPGHLREGTQQDNVDDMIERGRAFWQRNP